MAMTGGWTQEARDGPGLAWARGGPAFSIKLKNVDKDKLEEQKVFQSAVPLTKNQRADAHSKRKEGGSALWQVATQGAEEEFVVPELYLKAAGEATVLTAILCYAVTRLFWPQKLSDDPAPNNPTAR
jgi:hypothetical protein